jgi:Ca2+-binding EF-hand superfamily protein
VSQEYGAARVGDCRPADNRELLCIDGEGRTVRKMGRNGAEVVYLVRSARRCIASCFRNMTRNSQGRDGTRVAHALCSLPDASSGAVTPRGKIMAISIGSSYSNCSIDTQSTSNTDRTSQLLKQMDTDQDGKVSQSEFSAFGELMNAQGPMGPPPPPAPDGANVGSVGGTGRTSNTSSVQTAISSAGLFSQVDTNGDGSLSLDELSSMLAQGDARMAGSQGPPPPPPPPADSTTSGTSSVSSSSSGSTSKSTTTLSSLFSSADTDGDGSLSLNELTTLLGEIQSRSRSGGT